MARKQLDAQAIQSELRGQSAFFKQQPQTPGAEADSSTHVHPPDERISERKSERTPQRTDERTPDRTPALPIKRRTKRYSFEFYDDQLTQLKQLKIQAEMRGEGLSLSDMARQAFDEYLSDKPIERPEKRAEMRTHDIPNADPNGKRPA